MTLGSLLLLRNTGNELPVPPTTHHPPPTISTADFDFDFDFGVEITVDLFIGKKCAFFMKNLHGS
jgi:hypothetical protein